MNADLRGLVAELRECRKDFDGNMMEDWAEPVGVDCGLLRRAEEALSVAQGQGWLPIESAPRDGRARLVYVPLNKCIFCVSWREPCDAEDAVMYPAGWYFFGGSGRLTMAPSHYAELPAAPAQPDGVE